MQKKLGMGHKAFSVLALIVLILGIYSYLNAEEWDRVKVRVLNKSIDSGVSFLKKSLNEEEYRLSCISSNGNCPLDNKGDLFPLSFMVEATMEDLNEQEKSKIVDILKDYFYQNLYQGSQPLQASLS